MKFFASTVLLGFSSLVAAENTYWSGVDATDVAPENCAQPTPYFDCYKPIQPYENCDANDDACSCSSVRIEENCFYQFCTNLNYDDRDSTLFCTGTATAKPFHAPTGSSSPPRTDAIITPAPTSTSTSSSKSAATAAQATSKPNAAGGRAVAGGLLAAFAAAAGGFAY